MTSQYREVRDYFVTRVNKPKPVNIVKNHKPVHF
jgi:hypothetical protein